MRDQEKTLVKYNAVEAVDPGILVMPGPWGDHQEQRQQWNGASWSLECVYSPVHPSQGRAERVTQSPWRSPEDHD